MSGREDLGQVLERFYTVHVRRQLRHAHARVLTEAAVDFIKIDLFLIVTRSQERIFQQAVSDMDLRIRS